LRPEKWRVYRARAGSGSALTVDLRLDPEWGAGSSGAPFVKSVAGGLWVQIVPEGPAKGGQATFQWTAGVRAKFGVPDVSGLLVAMREVRVRGRAVPDQLGPRRKVDGQWVLTDQTKTTVGFTHRFAGAAGPRTTIIQYQFQADGGTLSISESAESRGRIRLSLSEELQWQVVLERALGVMLQWGL
jgi:hypothetical protein